MATHPSRGGRRGSISEILVIVACLVMALAFAGAIIWGVREAMLAAICLVAIILGVCYVLSNRPAPPPGPGDQESGARGQESEDDWDDRFVSLRMYPRLRG